MGGSVEKEGRYQGRPDMGDSPHHSDSLSCGHDYGTNSAVLTGMIGSEGREELWDMTVVVSSWA